MSIVACKECGHQVSTTAKSCPQCGAKPKTRKLWLWIPLWLFAAVFVYGAVTGPKNTTELAEMEAQACMRRQGDGEWRGSSGVSLETFCKTKGAIIGIKRACELNPSKC